jgi:hypothetical protein
MGKLMQEICNSTVESPKPRVRPSHVRVQSTLLPNDEQRKDHYMTHTVKEGDSVRSLAIKYRVSVASIKAANKMIVDDVMGFDEMSIPKHRNGVAPGQRYLSRMITVLPSVSWQSFVRQLCSAHGLDATGTQIAVQCVSKVQVDSYGHQIWVSLQSTEELEEELMNTEDASSSKDFLRIRIQEKSSGERVGVERKEKNPTLDSTAKRTGSKVVKQDVDRHEDEMLDEAGRAAASSPAPRVVVHAPSIDPYTGKGIGVAEQGAWAYCRSTAGRLCCCLCADIRDNRPANGPTPAQRFGKAAANEVEGVSLLQYEKQYGQR